MQAVQGDCDPRFSRVREAFERNFSEDGEVGAAVAVMLDGRMVVDLWGGHRDAARARAWERDTIVCMMSVAKAVSALCVHRLVEEGALDLDAPVARDWPEFAAEGKGAIPLRWVLCHLAGIPVADAAARGAMYDWAAMTRAIAAQAPLWPPGSTRCYHSATQGFILGELVRRVTGMSLGAYLRRHVAAPLGLDYAIGLDDTAIARCADMIPAAGTIFDAAQKGDRSTLLGRAWYPLGDGEDFNSQTWRRSEIPSANGHGNARAVARLYGALALGGTLDGVRVIGPEALDRATTEQWRGQSISSKLTFRTALGFFLSCPPDRPMGPNPRTFGHSGAGGAQGFADPDARLGFAYSPNRMHAGIDIGVRASRLIETTFACL
ncbi:MAG: beta-lactamase family protein [Alphaproteobacteria bacterium]|nr:beta-lactamase family protein [Alphaproteobacteria bacterium]